MIHCLFCGEICDVTKDPKTPTRWRPAYVCRQGETFKKKGLKDAIAESCEKRGDRQSDEIMIWLGGVMADLHAADARYHVECKARFICSRSIHAATNKTWEYNN